MTMATSTLQLGTRLFAGLVATTAALLAAVFLYHLSMIGDLAAWQDGVHWVFAGDWKAVGAALALGYLGCLMAAWLYLRCRGPA